MEHGKNNFRQLNDLMRVVEVEIFIVRISAGAALRKILLYFSGRQELLPNTPALELFFRNRSQGKPIEIIELKLQ
jgi:hypothetical protein